MNRSFVRCTLATAVMAAALCPMIACDDDDTTAVANTPSPDAATTPTPDAPSPPVDPPDASDAGPPAPVAVTLSFKAKVGTADFKCGTSYPGMGSTNATVTPRDLRFFVHDVKLLDAAGKAVPVTLDVRAPWQTAEVALLDFEDATGKCSNGTTEMNDKVTGTVPAGTYTGVVFTNGIPAPQNHADPATEAPPLSAGGMTWGWLLGHLFIKAEMGSADDGGTGLGLLHLGSVGCSNSPDGGDNDDFKKGPTMACKQPNLNEVKLTGFDPSKNAVVFDVKTLFASTDLTTPSMCHSGGPACPPLFTNVGLDINGGARKPTAPAFRVE